MRHARLVAPRAKEGVAQKLHIASRRQLVRLRVALAVHVAAAHTFLICSGRQTFLEVYYFFCCVFSFF